MTAMQYEVNRRRVLAMTAATLAMPGLARGTPMGTEWIEGRAFATTWSISAAEGARLERLRPEIETLLARIDRQMSPWRADSELSAVNRGAAGRQGVSEETAIVCRAALRVAEASDGFFDPTVGPLLSRWGIGPIEGDAANEWRGIRVTGSGIEKASATTTIDLCGIAKGWALDRMTDLVTGAGVENVLLDLGGEIRGVGMHPSGRPWRVAVEDPRDPGAAVAAVQLGDVAIATSGLAHQSFDIGGRHYGHIVDPHRGEPAVGALRSVSVLHEEATQADAWATALFAAGAFAGPAMARQRNISALFLTERQGALVHQTTGAADEVLLW